MQTTEFFPEDFLLSFDNDDATSDIHVFTDEKRFRSRLSLKEDVYFRTEIHEYRIQTDPINVEARLIERLDEPPPDKYAVKDGVVLESEITNERMPGMAASFVERLKKEVKWHKIEESHGSAVGYFILSLHPEIVPESEFRKYLRQKAEDIKTASRKIEEHLKNTESHGLQIMQGEFGTEIWLPDANNVPDEQITKARSYLETLLKDMFETESPSYVGILEGEFRNSQDILSSIEKLLNIKSKPVQKVVQTPSGGKGWKWAAVIGVSIVALYWGIWTAIGAFILGWLIIGLLSSK